VLAAWLVPPVGKLLPGGWSLMKANTALLALAIALSLTLCQPRRTSRQLIASRLLALFVALMATIVVLQYSFHFSAGVDTMLAADRGAAHPGRMSPQTATCFLLLAVVTVLMRAVKRGAAYVADASVFLLGLLILVILTGYMFGAMHLFGLSMSTRTSPQTLLCLSLLAIVAFGDRARYGAFSILLGAGIGSKVARIACPVALLLPFLLEAVKAGLIEKKQISVEYATAVSSAMP
jgi:hypothetical protein